MAQVYVRRKLIVGGHIFFPGRANIPDALILALDEDVKKQILILPPGTVLRGLWWSDEHGRPVVKWVAYVE